MKFIIIGLGNFGSSIAEKLSSFGHEIIGVDKDMTKVEAYKEKVTHTVCIDCKNEHSVRNLPLKQTDVVIVCIGEDESANIMASAIMKKNNVKRLITRAVSPLHENVLEAMGIKEIIHPEEETADRWAKKITMKGIVDSFMLSNEYAVIEAIVPERYVGKTLQESGIRNNYEIIVLTTIKESFEKNLLGNLSKSIEVHGIASSSTVLEKDDLLVMYGKLDDINRFLKK
jgi:trk system potassium uptake protein TrkA